MHLVAQPILLEIHGSHPAAARRRRAARAVGHELGHYLAHGPTSPQPPRGVMKNVGLVDDRRARCGASRFSMMRELTADRVALLACQDLKRSCA
jgi:hypothetical protein